jgi:hypothetical protein
MQVSVLGPMVTAGADNLRLRNRTVVGVLFVPGGSAVSTDEIADALCGDPPTVVPRGNSGSVRLRIDPCPEIAVLELAILTHDPELGCAPRCVRARVVRGPVCSPMKPRIAEAFFGRDCEISHCWYRLERADVLVAVGASACGKSSLVRAGLLPGLSASPRSGFLVTPGPHPLGAVIFHAADGRITMGDQDLSVPITCVGIPFLQTGRMRIRTPLHAI